MEGDPQDQEEDSEAQRRASSPQSSVLWEKCIRQSIFVDLSEDESLHFSDLEGSFTVHLSQAESAISGNSIHLSENLELSVSDSGESSTESRSCVSGQSERVVEGSGKWVSAQRPNTEQEQPIWEYENAGDTSDEEQEDLPHDGALGSQYIKPSTNDSHKSEENCKIAGVLSKEQAGAMHSRHNVRDHFDLPAMVGEVNIIQGHMQIEVNTMNHVSITPPEGEGKGAFFDSTEAVPTCSSPVHKVPHPDITQLLLRHFSQDELFCSGSLIEAETLPEVSLLESMDETVLSRGPLHRSTGSPSNNNSGGVPRRSSTGGPSSESERSQSLQEEDEGKSVQMSPRKNLEEKNGRRTASEGKNTRSAESYSSDVNSPQNSGLSTSKREVPEQDSNGSNGSDLTKEEDENDEDEEEDHICRGLLVRTRSFSELKYGQGQVHYPLPDFSKVAPKVKIPKSVPVRPVSQSPSFLRAQSSPGMLGKSSALEVIHRVMEDSIQPSERPYVFRDQDKQTETSPGLVRHLQAEYDKLMTKYAEAENLLDQMRLGTKNQASSDLTLDFDCGDQQDLPGPGGSHFGSMLFPNPPSPTGQFTDGPDQQNHSQQPRTSPTQTDQQSEGERMTRELRDIISQFLQKVDEFKTCLTTMSIAIEEQEMVFKSMMDSQDQLERRYISKKEEHRTLEMQNYFGLARNTGQFDPERQVEGEIFRIGMHLEDIKELIDRNVREQQLSPPHSSSALLSLCGGPSLPGLLTPSLSPPMHEGLTVQIPGSCFSTGGYETVEREEEEASEVHGHDGLDQSCDLTPADPQLNSTGHSSGSLRLSQCSLETVDITNTEEEEERSWTCSGLSERKARDRVLQYLALQNPGFRDRLWTTESLQQSPLSPACDLGGSVSLAVEVSCSSCLKSQSQSITDHTLTTSQRIVSPETDSGLGSSDLSLQTTGLPQPKPHTERLQLQPDGNSSPISMSDSEGSCTNLQTTMHQPVQVGERRPNPQRNVHSAGLTGNATPILQSTVHLTRDIGERRPSLQTPAELQRCTTAVDRCVTSTTQSIPARLHEGESHTTSQLSHHGPDCPFKTSHSITMDMPQRDCHSHTCSCHSSAIQALQSEVSQLKRDLKEGLVQLPHLSQRMDYLTSRCRQNRDRRPKTRPRTHHKPAGSRQSLTNTNSKIEDWISSDMDPSKSKGTDGVESDRSGIVLPFHSTPLDGRRGSSKPYSCSDGPVKPQSRKHLNTASEENRSLETSNLTHPSPPALWHSYKNFSYRSPPPPGNIENVYSKGRYHLSSQPLQKPLLQVNYCSSCSLPAGFKVREQQSASHHRRRSTQSDSALLPSPPRTGVIASRPKASRDEDINRTLDRAIEAARIMKRTTDRMAKSLSADLAKVELYRKLHGLHPLTGRNNTGS